jgi:4-hydroxybenzoate polyprenyltransferase
MARHHFRLGRRLTAWVEAAHPYPVAMVLALTLLLGFASADGSPDASQLALAVSAMLLSQVAIGWTNDYVDRESDALYQPWKPVASGALAASALRPAAFVAAASAFVVAGFLGFLSLAFCAIGTAAGIAYDLKLKDTSLSWLPYMVGFAVLPPFVWSAIDAFEAVFLWLYPIAAPLVLAVHLGQVLPDVDDDRRALRGGIAVSLGRATAARLLLLCLVLPPALALLSLGWLEYDPAILGAVLAAYVALLALALYLYGRPGGERAAYRPLALAAVLFSAGWLAAV